MEHEPDPRHAKLIVKSCDDSISQEKVGRGVDDISTTERIANETIPQRGDENGVFVAGQARSVILEEGIGTSHAEIDGTIDDQFEASWTIFEETSTTCAVVRRTGIHSKRCTTRRVW